MRLVKVVRRYKRSATALVIVSFLMVQSAYSFLVNPEPYPTIRMPAFGAAGKASGEIALRTARVTAVGEDGSESPVRVTTLMSELPFSASAPTFAHLFGPDAPEPEAATIVWLQDRLQSVTGRTHLRAMKICWEDQQLRIADASVVSSSPCIWREVEL